MTFKLMNPRICPLCGEEWHDDQEECGNEV